MNAWLLVFCIACAVLGLPWCVLTIMDGMHDRQRLLAAERRYDEACEEMRQRW